MTNAQKAYAYFQERMMEDSYSPTEDQLDRLAERFDCDPKDIDDVADAESEKRFEEGMVETFGSVRPTRDHARFIALVNGWREPDEEDYP